jgi:hypothetical protein
VASVAPEKRKPAECCEHPTGPLNPSSQEDSMSILARRQPQLHTAAPVAPADDLGDVEADPSEWPAWTDSDVWTISESPPPLPSRRGPTSEDRAFEMGRSAALDSEGPVEAPAGLTRAERSSFVAGVSVGLAFLLAKLQADELKARHDHGERAEARMATGGRCG